MPDTLVLDKPNLFSYYQFHRREALYRQLTQATMVVTLSEFSKQRLRHHLEIPHERLHVIPLGADALEQAAPDVNLHLPKHYVFYPANFWPHKRYDLLFRIMKLIWEQQADMHLILSGGRGSHSTGEVNGLIHRYQCPRDHVLDMGYVTDGQLRILYQHAEALLFVSEYEGFGMPLLEAMQYRCPVICAPVTSIPEVVAEAGLYVRSDRPEDWAKAFLQELPQQRQTLVQKGISRAQRFTWQKTRAAWTAIFEECGLNFSHATQLISAPNLENDQHRFLAQFETITQGAASGMSRRQEILNLIRHCSQFQAVRHKAQSALSTYLLT
jgi:glycosyltransferase involved in cell wall biosynthesis